MNGKYTVNIGKAVGEFEGDKAFTTRKWNVRLHAFEELGAVKSVTVNGKRISNELLHSQQRRFSVLVYGRVRRYRRVSVLFLGKRDAGDDDRR